MIAQFQNESTQSINKLEKIIYHYNFFDQSLEDRNYEKYSKVP